jgi:hypothetical protein
VSICNRADFLLSIHIQFQSFDERSPP